MSLMKTFARVAAGVMLAKGIGAVMKNQQSRGRRLPDDRSGGRSGGGLLDDLFGNNTGGDIGDRLGQVLGGRGTRRYGGSGTTGAQDGLGGLLDSLTRQSGGGLQGSRRQAGNEGLGDLLGGMLGGAAGGGLARQGSQPANDASFGELFNDAVIRNNEPEIAPTPEQNAMAGLMLKAMIQAAKSDGRIDDAEKQKLMDQLGDDLDEEERRFIREQMAAPVDAGALAQEVPQGFEAQVYLVSLLAIDFDTKEEARYLHALAQALGLQTQAVNQIHAEAGARPLYD
ncbi:tellurite resistance TerB family protein [Paracoccus sp. (in: a-proteobacteria)]|uniref:tellurite resistance TerB family protein n=1 Tax=Paracoccus sp. TaxID=267 RepID=UPI003A87155C